MPSFLEIGSVVHFRLLSSVHILLIIPHRKRLYQHEAMAILDFDEVGSPAWELQRLAISPGLLVQSPLQCPYCIFYPHKAS
jgi:hypothetical protein